MVHQTGSFDLPMVDEGAHWDCTLLHAIEYRYGLRLASCHAGSRLPPCKPDLIPPPPLLQCQPPPPPPPAMLT